jgi:5-methylcytosine-specific restriction endonuclease McrA
VGMRGNVAVELMAAEEALSARACRFCRRPVRALRTWCGSECVDAWRVAQGDGRVVRRLLWERDCGVCARCARDTKVVAGDLSGLREEAGVALLVALGWTQCSAAYALRVGRLPYTLWQADHVVPVVLGGLNVLSNYRTLCGPCHASETRELARARARDRLSATARGALGGARG